MMMNSMEANFFFAYFFCSFSNEILNFFPVLSVIRIQIIIKYKTNHKYIFFFLKGKKNWNEMRVLIVASKILYGCTNAEKWFGVVQRKIVFWKHINPLNFEWLRIRRAHSSPNNCSLIHKLLLQKAGGYEWKEEKKQSDLWWAETLFV